VENDNDLVKRMKNGPMTIQLEKDKEKDNRG